MVTLRRPISQYNKSPSVESILFVEANHVCGSQSYLWKPIMFVEANHICGSRSYLWKPTMFVEANHICGSQSYLWESILSTMPPPGGCHQANREKVSLPQLLI